MSAVEVLLIQDLSRNGAKAAVAGAAVVDDFVSPFVFSFLLTLVVLWLCKCGDPNVCDEGQAIVTCTRSLGASHWLRQSTN
jgi:hypothetical protein